LTTVTVVTSGVLALIEVLDVASVVDISTSLDHGGISELRALNQLDTSVVVLLEDLGQVTIGNGGVSWLIPGRWTDETTVSWVTHGEVRSQILVKSTLSVEGLRGVLELTVRGDSFRIKEVLIDITIRVGIDVCLSVIEVCVGVVSQIIGTSKSVGAS
jgi:hypothetical protein